MDEGDSDVGGRSISAGGNLNQTIEAEELSSARLGKLGGHFCLKGRAFGDTKSGLI